MSDATRLSTRLNRKWLTKMSIFMAALVILGVWGAVDALWLYPRRGEHHATFMLKDYLQKLSDEGSLVRAASIEDPEGEHRRLSQMNPPPSGGEAARLAWLDSLGRIHNLGALARQNQEAKAGAGATGTPNTRTMFADPSSRLDELTKDLANRNVPKPLSAYDIPLQYVFAVAGLGGAVSMVFFLLGCKRVRFEYDPQEKRLFLPSGKSFVPADISEVDKRDWHKYFLYMRINGFEGEQKFDLLRYSPLEDWLEEMRRLRPGYDPAEDEPQQGDAAAAAGAGELEPASAEGGPAVAQEEDKPRA